MKSLGEGNKGGLWSGQEGDKQVAKEAQGQWRGVIFFDSSFNHSSQAQAFNNTQG